MPLLRTSNEPFVLLSVPARRTMSRLLSFGVLGTAASLAGAFNAFSNLDPAPNAYTKGAAYGVSAARDQGFQFVPTASGSLSGFMVAMNNSSSDPFPEGFRLSLYADAGDVLGDLLGTYRSLSTGVGYGATSQALAFVPASGVELVAGTPYWLLAISDEPLATQPLWNFSNTGRTIRVTNGDYSLPGARAAAFSVQTVPEPTSLAALALGLSLAARRQRKAAR